MVKVLGCGTRGPGLNVSHSQVDFFNPVVKGGRKKLRICLFEIVWGQRTQTARYLKISLAFLAVVEAKWLE